MSGRFAGLANTIKVYEVDPPEGDGPMGAPSSLPGRAVAVWPNPFRSRCAFSFPVSRDASASIYDANGRLVRELEVHRDKGNLATASWNGTDRTGNSVSSGIYYCVVSSGGSRTRIKVVKQ